MKLRAVIIDEPIRVKHPLAESLWQKTMWAKEAGYRKAYSGHFLPVSTDDFFGTHLIVAEQKPDGTLIPVAMYKSVRKSQALKFECPWGLTNMLKNYAPQFLNDFNQLIDSYSEISYDSSFTINPEYKGDKAFSLEIRNFITLFCFKYHQEFNFSSWISGGSTLFKIDEYFERMGCSEILGGIRLPQFNHQIVRFFHMKDTFHINNETKIIIDEMTPYWDDRIVFTPKKDSKQNPNQMKAA